MANTCIANNKCFEVKGCDRLYINNLRERYMPEKKAHVHLMKIKESLIYEAMSLCVK